MEERFNKSLKEAPEWQIKSFEKLKKSFPEYELLDWKQKRYLLWLWGQWNIFTESCGMIDYKKIETLI